MLTEAFCLWCYMLLKSERCDHNWNIGMSSQIVNWLTRNLWDAYSVQGTVLGFVWIILDLTRAPWGLYLKMDVYKKIKLK